MSMYIFKEFDSLPLTAIVGSGVSSFVLDGDQRALSWLQPGDEIRLVEGTNEDILVVDSTSYNSTPDETTVNTTTSTSFSYTLEGNVYSLRTRIKKQVGFLEGDGLTTAFTCTIPETESPSEVRRFATGASYGQLLTEGAEHDWEWNDPTDQVLLDATPNVGETIVAYGPGNWLFSEQFLSEGVQEEYTEDVYLYITTDYDCIYCGLSEVMTSEISSSWFNIGEEITAGQWDFAASQLFCGFSAGDVIHFKVKMAFPPESTYTESVRNYYNTSLYLGNLTLPTN